MFFVLTGDRRKRFRTSGFCFAARRTNSTRTCENSTLKRPSPFFKTLKYFHTQSSRASGCSGHFCVLRGRLSTENCLPLLPDRSDGPGLCYSAGSSLALSSLETLRNALLLRLHTTTTHTVKPCFTTRTQRHEDDDDKHVEHARTVLSEKCLELFFRRRLRLD